jgi:hypothetical protein
LRPGIPTGRGSGLKHRPVWVRIPPGAHNVDMVQAISCRKIKSKLAVAMLALVLGLSLAGCTSHTVTSEVSPTGAQFELDNPNDTTFTDDAGNELLVGDNLELPSNWPAAVPTPPGRLIAVSIVDESTAVATWQVEGDVNQAEDALVQEMSDSGFVVIRSDDLSTETISVFTAEGNDLDVTVSATPGANTGDSGEITLLVNPAF